MDKTTVEWNDLLKMAAGTIIEDFFEDGVRVLVMRGPGALCAYVGVPIGHPLAGFSYDDIPLDVHGGLTFGREGDKLRPKDYYWYGWDYAHSGDYCFYNDLLPVSFVSSLEEKKWLPDEVKWEAQQAAWNFKKLMGIAEKLYPQLSAQTEAYNDLQSRLALYEKVVEAAGNLKNHEWPPHEPEYNIIEIDKDAYDRLNQALADLRRESEIEKGSV